MYLGMKHSTFLLDILALKFGKIRVTHGALNRTIIHGVSDYEDS